MRVVVEQPFWDLFPEAVIGIVEARGLRNLARPGDRTEAALAEAAGRAAAELAGHDLAAHPAVAPWRAAYARFGAKPSKYRSSIESLLRAALAGRTRPINPLVNLYNAVSLAHLLPCGGEDAAAIEGDLRLALAAGGEPFVPLGGSGDEPPQPGEVIYRDDAGAVCRCWNWREARRTMLTEATTHAVLVIEGLPEHGRERVRAACDDLAARIVEHLGGSAEVAVLAQASPAYATPDGGR